MRNLLRFLLLIVAAGCAGDDPSVGSVTQHDTIYVYGTAPPDCRVTHGPNWDNAYEGEDWVGCDCTFGCYHGDGQGGADGSDPADYDEHGAPGDGYETARERYERVESCLDACWALGTSWYASCFAYGNDDPDAYCPVVRWSGHCPGVGEICREYLRRADGTHIPDSCYRSRLPACVQAFAACEAGWRNGAGKQGAAYVRSCQEGTQDQTQDCLASCLNDLAEDLLCDKDDAVHPIENGTINNGWCMSRDGDVTASCVYPPYCQLGPEALD